MVAVTPFWRNRLHIVILVANHTNFVCRLLGGSAAADASRLASNYLCAVAYGQHVQGREFEFIAAAPWNRLTFLNACKDVLQRVARQFFVQPAHLQQCHVLTFPVVCFVYERHTHLARTKSFVVQTVLQPVCNLLW